MKKFNLDEKTLLLKLVSFDTQNSDVFSSISSTDPALDFIANLLDENKIKVEFQEYPVSDRQDHRNKMIRRNLLARLYEDRGDLPTLGLQGHIDTVSFNNYEGNPLGELKDNKLYGRGVVDMKGSLACMIHSIILSKRAKHPSVNPQLIITSDEEANSFAGIKRYLSDKPSLDFAICGEPTSIKVQDRFKGALYMRLKVQGKTGHGSRQFEGENAIAKSFPIFVALIELYKEIPKIKNPLFISKYIHSDESSMNIGVIRGGTKVNIIPDEVNFEFEMRLVKPSELYWKLIDEKLKPFRHLIKNYEKVFSEEPAIFRMDKSNPFFNRLERLSKSPKGVVFGFSESSKMNNSGIPTVDYGVGRSIMCHKNVEYIPISQLISYRKKLSSLIK